MDNEQTDLTYYLNVILKRLWLIATLGLAGILCAVLINILSRPVYDSSVMLMIDREDSGKIVDPVRQLSSWSSDEDYYRTQYNLLESRSILEEVYNKLNLASVEQFAAPDGIKKLKNALEITPISRSRLVNIDVFAYDPALSAAIANTLADTFVQNNITSRVTIAKDVIDALESTQKSQKEQELLNSMPQVVNSDFIKNLKQQESQLDMQYANLSSKYTQNHPDIIAVKNQIAAIRATINTETERIVQSIKIDLSGQFSANNIRIVDRATAPKIPAKPRKALNIIIGFAAGIVLALLISFILEFIDQTVKTSDDVEAKLKLPFLGFVPQESIKNGTAEYASMLKKGNFLLPENIRNIRTMIDFSLSGNKNESFLVTSAMQGEGKSNLSANIAVAIAQTGKKVLIIDGDLRRPRMHRIFRISTDKGLSNIWSKDAAKADYAANVQAVADVPNLFVLTSGMRPPNPAELLNTPKLKDFIEWAGQNYEQVIIDCPAIVPVSDTLLWGRYVKKAVFVISQGKTNIKIIKSAADKLSKAGIEIMGSVIGHYNFESMSYRYGYGRHGYYKSYHYYNNEDK
jgi:capsular exopolysaccharide family